MTRLAAGLALVAAATVALGGVASAHVTITDPGEPGGFSIVTFSVPNERDDASTERVEVQLPQDAPLAFVSAQPKPGWEVEVTMRTLDEPIEAFGEELSEVVDTVTWSGGPIGPGQFDTFSLSVGPLPTDVDGVAFPAIQTYDSGEEVAWIEETPEGGEEPEHPAPVLALESGSGGHTEAGTETDADDGSDEVAVDAEPVTSSDDDGTDALTIVALVVGVLGLLAGGAALATGRQRR